MAGPRNDCRARGGRAGAPSDQVVHAPRGLCSDPAFGGGGKAAFQAPLETWLLTPAGASHK